MGQEEVMNILRNNKNKWLDAKQIRILMGKNTSGQASTSRTLKCLRQQRVVEYEMKRVPNSGVGYYLYKYIDTK